MIHDVQVEVSCDGKERCYQSLYLRPDLVYGGILHTSEQYDTSDKAINTKVEQEGWSVVDGKHFCEECREER